MKSKKIKLGQTVYCVNNDDLAITREVVYAIGKDVIIPEGFDAYAEGYLEVEFENVYTTLKAAKSALRKEYLRLRQEYGINAAKLCEYAEGYWRYE